MEVFKKHVQEFVQPSSKPQLLEVFVSDINEATAYNMIVESNKSGDISNGVKQRIKRLIGEDNTRKIKGIFN